jgi:hypothetical protein
VYAFDTVKELERRTGTKFPNPQKMYETFVGEIRFLRMPRLGIYHTETN